jgi:hypothetical protein
MMFGLCSCIKIVKFGVRPPDFDGVTPNKVELSNIYPVQCGIQIEPV